jgi:hypothetical protein
MSNDNNLFENLIWESPNKNIFGNIEDPEDRIIDKIEYANNKYLEFKQKMRFLRERKRRQKNIANNEDYSNTSNVHQKVDRDKDLSPYQKALLKEEARKKLALLQKQECMTQRAFENFKNSLKNTENIYDLGEVTLIHTNKNSIPEGIYASAMEWEKKREKQKQLLLIKGEKKNIQTDAAFVQLARTNGILFIHLFLVATTKRQFQEKQDNKMLKLRRKKNAINMQLDINAQRNSNSRKEIVIKDSISSYGKRTFSSHIVSKKAKQRNSNMSTFDSSSAKNNVECNKSSTLTMKLSQTKYNIPERPILGEIDRIVEKPIVPQKYKRNQAQKTASNFMLPHDDWVKEQEKKFLLRKKANEKYNSISANFKSQVQKEAYKYIVMKGNNWGVIKRCMENRSGWEETVDFDTMFNFRWQQTSHGLRFGQLSINGKRQIVNHFPNHYVITTKDNLFKNLYEMLDTKVFNFVPLTVWIESDSENYNKEINTFNWIYNIFDKYKQDWVESGMIPWEMNEEIGKQIFLSSITKKSTRSKPSSFQLADTHFTGYNLWFLKVTKLNRGRGIYVFDTYEKLVSLIKDLEEGVVMNANDANNASMDAGKERDCTFSNVSSVPNKIQSSTFVIQKYIESPLLIKNRKFDIRVWVLLTHDLKVYFFKEGYLRTSWEDFSLKSEDVWKQFVHLTNNAVQKHSDNYGQFEDGNQMSFEEFQNYIDENFADSDISVKDKLANDMKEIVKLTFKSAENMLFVNNKKSSFEIFGYDFIVDSQFKLWLIEINTNPCLEESSNLLKKLIPRMVDDALKLTLDVIFKKRSKGKSPRKFILDVTPVNQEIFSVDGYEDAENMWEIIL